MTDVQTLSGHERISEAAASAKLKLGLTKGYLAEVICVERVLTTTHRLSFTINDARVLINQPINIATMKLMHPYKNPGTAEVEVLLRTSDDSWERLNVQRCTFGLMTYELSFEPTTPGAPPADLLKMVTAERAYILFLSPPVDP